METWESPLLEALKVFEVTPLQEATYSLRMKASDSPEFTIKVVQGELFHIVMKLVGFRAGVDRAAQLQACLSLNRAAAGFYFAVSLRGEAEVHCSFYRHSSFSTIPGLLDAMMRWCLCYEDRLKGVTARVAKLSGPAEFREVAEIMRFQEYTYVNDCSKVELHTMLQFSRFSTRYLSVEVRLRLLADEASPRIKVRSIGSLQCLSDTPNNWPLISVQPRKGRLVVKTCCESLAPLPMCVATAKSILVLLLSISPILSAEKKQSLTLAESLRFHNFLQQVNPGLSDYFSIMSDIGARIAMDHNCALAACPLPHYTEIRFADEDAYCKANEEYRKTREAFRFKMTPVCLERVRFLPGQRTAIVDTSGLVPITAVLSKASYKETYTHTLNLISALTTLREVNYGLNALMSSWYLTPASKPLLLPTWQASCCSLVPGSISNPTLFIFAALKSWGKLKGLKVCLADLCDSPISSFIPPSSKKSLLFSASSETSAEIPLMKSIEKMYWLVTAQQEVDALECPSAQSSVAIDRRETSALLYVVKTRPRQLDAVMMKSLLIEGKMQALMKVGEYLLRAQEKGIAHLMLTPKTVKSRGVDVVVTGFKRSIYRISEKYVKTGKDPDFCDFLDPAVVSYLWWKRTESPTAAKKLNKYVNRIDARCDIYSFALLIYYCLLPSERPFDYLPDPPLTLDAVYQQVIKPHRRPLICESFERAFPQFTDALRRSWEAAPLRPSLRELIAFLPAYEDFAANRITAR